MAAQKTNATQLEPTTGSNVPTPSGPGLVKPPPSVKIPAPPAGFVPSNPKDYRGFRPKSSELAVVPDAIMELAGFTDYDTTFGKTAPPVSDVTQSLDAASQWTALLADTSDWMGYVKSQEGMAWKDTLTIVDKLKAPFALAVTHDPSINSRYPALARLLGAAKVIAKRGVATKARAKAAAAKGLPVKTKGKKATPPATGGAVPAAAPAAQPAPATTAPAAATHNGQ